MNMATSTFRLIFEVGSYVKFQEKLCYVSDRDNSKGYNVYNFACIGNVEETLALAHQMDDATEEGELFMRELQDINNDTDFEQSNEDIKVSTVAEVCIQKERKGLQQ